MDFHLTWIVSNSVLATALAIAVFVLSRLHFIRCRPAVLVGLWLVVLAKFVTPPLIELPIPTPGFAATPGTPAHNSTSLATNRPAPNLVRRNSPQPDRTATKSAAAVQSNPVADARLKTSDSMKVGNGPGNAAREVERSTASAWLAVLGGVWLCGTCLLIAGAGRQFLRFRRFMAVAEKPDRLLAEQCRDVAGRLRLCTPPEVRVVSGPIGPALVGVGKRASVVVSKSLFARLSHEQRDQVLAHEFAHFARRDHWWNLFSYLVSAVVWWHPVGWWARRRLGAAQDLCCDGLAVAALDGTARCYAETLLKVVDELAAVRSPLPTLACGFGNVTTFKRRLTVLLQPNFSHRRPWYLYPLLLLSMALLPYALGAASPAAPPEAPKPPVAKPAAVKPMKVYILDDAGQPIKDAYLEVRRGIRKKMTTHKPSAEGLVVIDVPARDPDVLELHAKAPKHVWVRARWFNIPDHRKQPVPGEVRFKLEPGDTAGGTVVDPKGRPIAGAILKFSADAGFSIWAQRYQQVWEYRAKTDAKGRWRFPLLPSRVRLVSATVSHPDFASGGFTVLAGSEAMKELKQSAHKTVLKPGVVVEGHVTDKNNRPIAGAVVGLGDQGDQNPPVRTNKRGIFRFTKVKPGPTVVTVVARGFAPAQQQIEAGPDLDAIDFHLQPGKRVSIRVTDRKGNPIADANVFPGTWDSRQSLTHLYRLANPLRTGKDGRVVWTEAPAEPLRFDILKSGYTAVRNRVLNAGKNTHEITMLPTLRVSGTVRDAKTNQPVKSFQITHGVEINGNRIFWYDSQSHAGNDGKYQYTFGEASNRESYIKVEAPGYRRQTVRVMSPASGKLRRDFRLTPAVGP